MSTAANFPIKLDFEVTFPDAKYAKIVANTVAIDEDVKADRIYKDVSVHDNIVKVAVHGSDARIVRVTAGAIIDMIQLSTKTMAAFS